MPQVPWFLDYKHVVCSARIQDDGRVLLPSRNPVSVFGGNPVSESVRPV